MGDGSGAGCWRVEAMFSLEIPIPGQMTGELGISIAPPNTLFSVIPVPKVSFTYHLHQAENAVAST